MLTVRFRVNAAEEAADRIERAVARAEIALAAVDAVNVVAKRADASIRRAENANIGLTDAYVKSKTDLRLASREPRAEITTRGDLTILGRYNLQQLIVQAKGVRRAAGDPKRGIPAGQKQAGLRVDIKPSTPTYQTKWFTMTLRRGTQAGDNVGVFVRTGPRSTKHIYGPSPYSLARFQIGVQSDEILNDLERTATSAVVKQVEGAIR